MLPVSTLQFDVKDFKPASCTFLVRVHPNPVEPDVLSLSVLNPNVLRPSVLNPNVLSPSVLSSNALTPNVLSPNTLSPGADMFWFVSASNVSLLAAETLITPLPPCQSTILPPDTTGFITQTADSPYPQPSIPSNWTSTDDSQSSRVRGGQPKMPPETTTAGEGAEASESPIFDGPVGGPSPIFSSLPFTSTVTVTKKTPVPVVTPTRPNQPPVFDKPTTTKPATTKPATTKPATTKPPTDDKPTTYEKSSTQQKPQPTSPGQGGPTAQPGKPNESPTSQDANKPGDNSPPQSTIPPESTDSNKGTTSPESPAGGSSSGGSSGGGTTGGGTTGGGSSGGGSSGGGTTGGGSSGGGSSGGGSSGGGSSGGGTSGGGTSGGGTSDGGASGGGSTGGGTTGTGESPSSPVIEVNDVSISVGDSSIVVGTQTIAIPTTGAATVRVGSELFTIEPSSLLASGTTVALGPLQQATAAYAAPPTTITAAPGVIVVVQGSIAVVDGTTYAIGSDAAQTTISVSGQRIELGPSGVVLASTTIPANYATRGSGLVVESYEDLTFSVGATVAVVDGTTYAIGSGAATTHVTIDGQTVSFGPGGVGVEGKTTFKPTTVTTAAGTGATATDNTRTATGSGASATATDVVESNGSVALGRGSKSGKWIDIVLGHWSYLVLAALGLLA
ncbi:hypothetical protein DV738_g4388, partial [Chaetothyriales sp. CBS 135597]